MIDVIAKIAFACSFIAGTLTLVEWFLSERQKEYVQNVALEKWSDLDDVKLRRIVLDFRSTTPQLVLGILSLTASLIFMSASYAEITRGDPAAFWTFIVSLLVSAVLIVKWLLPRLQIYFWSNRGIESYRWTTFRLWLGMTVIYLLWAMVFLSAFMYATGVTRLVGIFLDVLITTGRNTILALIYFIILAKISFLVRPSVITSELVLRRIAESSKGTLLAIAGLSSAIGSFLKLFVST